MSEGPRAARKPWHLGVGFALGAVFSACGVGSGSGVVDGDLTMLGCRMNQDIMGTWRLGPTFFAGEPFDDSSPAKTKNLLMVRVQRTAARPESADGVTFYISSTYEVARCVSGYTAPDGTPDWDPAQCDRSQGTARMSVGDGGQVVQSTFTPFQSCPNAGLLDGYSALLSGVALGACDSTDPAAQALNPVGCPASCPFRDSWIEFTTFGGVSLDRQVKVDPRFIVNFGEAIKASFHLGLCDGSVVQANLERRFAPPPRLFGTMDGRFDFDLRRGQGAQAFP